MDNNSIDKKTATTGIVILYFLFLFKAGFSFVEQNTRITAPLFIAIILLVNGKRKIYIDRQKPMFTLLFMGLILINYILNGFPDGNVIAVVVLNMITALLITCVISEEVFLSSFIKLIYYICIASIIGFAIMMVYKPIINILPALTNSTGRIGRYAVLTIISDFASSTAGLQRVQGLFWEPGAFQCMIVFAVIFEIFKFKSLTLKKMIVYCLTIVLTFSTTGYVCMIILIALAINKETRSFKLLRASLIIVAMVIFYLSMQNTEIAFLRYTMFGKIQMIFNYQSGVRTLASSRVDSIILPLRHFLDDPLFGIGVNGYANLTTIVGHSMFTCTPVNYFVYYGILFGGISFYGMWRFFRVRGLSIVNGILLLICVLVTLSTEAFTLNPILTCMILYGLTNSSPQVRYINSL